MDISRRSFLGILLTALLVSCGIPAAQPAPTPSPTATPEATPAATATPSFPVTVTDFNGAQVTIAARPERIVSIGPSNTEFLFALGAGARVIAVDDFSDEPAAARELPKVGGFRPNVEQIVALRPDLVVSVKISGGPLEQIAAQGITVLVVDPQGIDDAIDTAVLLGTAVGEDGEALAASMRERLDAVRAEAMAVSPKRVFHEVDASDPTKPYTVGPGSFVHDIIELVGGINVAAGTGMPYPQLSAEEIVRADPEVIVLADFDYGVTLESVMARPGWDAITAVRNGRIVPVDANLMSRPGPRLPEAAEAYLRIIRETP